MVKEGLEGLSHFTEGDFHCCPLSDLSGNRGFGVKSGKRDLIICFRDI